jgi:hypothetical protein
MSNACMLWENGVIILPLLGCSYIVIYIDDIHNLTITCFDKYTYGKCGADESAHINIFRSIEIIPAGTQKCHWSKSYVSPRRELNLFSFHLKQRRHPVSTRVIQINRWIQLDLVKLSPHAFVHIYIWSMVSTLNVSVAEERSIRSFHRGRSGLCLLLVALLLEQTRWSDNVFRIECKWDTATTASECRDRLWRRMPPTVTETSTAVAHQLLRISFRKSGNWQERTAQSYFSRPRSGVSRNNARNKLSTTRIMNQASNGIMAGAKHPWASAGDGSWVIARCSLLFYLFVSRGAWVCAGRSGRTEYITNITITVTCVSRMCHTITIIDTACR